MVPCDVLQEWLFLGVPIIAQSYYFQIVNYCIPVAILWILVVLNALFIQLLIHRNRDVLHTWILWIDVDVWHCHLEVFCALMTPILCWIGNLFIALSNKNHLGTILCAWFYCAYGLYYRLTLRTWLCRNAQEQELSRALFSQEQMG